MRGRAEEVLYVGKAKCLRKRLASYRVANPDRLPRRHLRLLRAVTQIDLEECADEAAALAREAELLRSLRPPFNRAGMWRGTPRYLGFSKQKAGYEMCIAQEIVQGWEWHGPTGAGVRWLRAALLRLLWCAVHSEREFEHLPAGWCRANRGELMTLSRFGGSATVIQEAVPRLRGFFAGEAEDFMGWMRDCTKNRTGSFERAFLEAGLEALKLLSRPKAASGDLVPAAAVK